MANTIKMTQDHQDRATRRRNLTTTERKAVLARMYAEATKLRLPNRLLCDLAREFDCSERSLSRLWKNAREKIKAGTVHDGESGRRGRSGRKGRLSEEFAAELATTIALLPLHERTSIRTLAERLGIPKTSVHVYYQSGAFRSHHAHLKPHLTAENRAARVTFALSFIQPGPLSSLRYDSMHDYVHLDEKWFYLKKDKARYYLAPGEEAPHVTVRHKSFILKVMFLVAIARPRWDSHKKKVWDGKIGLWPFVVYEPAQRKSKNRDAGTLELKTYTVDREIYRRCLVSSVIPEIKRQWPSGKRVRIQQDNAKPHVLVDDAAVNAACAEGGWDMCLAPQPPNSPDFNVLDLGFFSSLQTLQHRKPSTSIEQLVNNVEDAFRELSYTCIDRVFMTLQTVLDASLQKEGGNRYLIPHKNKSALVDSSGLLPLTLPCSRDVYNDALQLSAVAPNEAAF